MSSGSCSSSYVSHSCSCQTQGRRLLLVCVSVCVWVFVCVCVCDVRRIQLKHISPRTGQNKHIHQAHLANNIPMKSITAEEMTRWARSTGGEAAEWERERERRTARGRRVIRAERHLAQRTPTSVSPDFDMGLIRLMRAVMSKWGTLVEQHKLSFTDRGVYPHRRWLRRANQRRGAGRGWGEPFPRSVGKFNMPTTVIMVKKEEGLSQGAASLLVFSCNNKPGFWSTWSACACWDGGRACLSMPVNSSPQSESVESSGRVWGVGARIYAIVNYSLSTTVFLN